LPFDFRTNSKFALLAIPGIGSELPDVEYQLPDGTWVMPRMPSVADLDKWKLWIGSIRADGLQRTNLALLIEEESANPFVLDQTHLRLKEDLSLLYYCLQLKPGIESQEPDLLLGSCVDGEVLIRQMNKFSPFKHSKGYTRAPVSQDWLEEAYAFRAGITALPPPAPASDSPRSRTPAAAPAPRVGRTPEGAPRERVGSSANFAVAVAADLRGIVHSQLHARAAN